MALKRFFNNTYTGLFSELPVTATTGTIFLSENTQELYGYDTNKLPFIVGDTTLWSASTGTNSLVPTNSDLIASGDYSIAIGLTTIASGNYSHAEGNETIASGDGSHAGGYLSTANGAYSFAHGQSLYVDGDRSVVLGGFSNQITTSNNTGIFVGNNNTIFSGSGNVILGGLGNTISGHTNSAIIAGSGNTIDFDLTNSYNHGEVILGSDNSTISATTVTSIISSSGSSINYGSWRSSIIGGANNSMHQAFSSAIIGGSGNVIGAVGSNTNNVVVLACTNLISPPLSDIVCVPNLMITGLTSTDPIATDIDGKIVAGTSDIRLKQNISNLTNSLSTINNLRGVSFEYTPESNMGGGIRYGFIAQEVEKIVPDIVRFRAGGSGMLSLNISWGGKRIIFWNYNIK